MSRHKDLLILPVGAFEQHGPHLPMDTDCRIAEYFSRILAERFNGALLPVQAIASSLEHTGWRGAFTLRPETLMAVIRDIAETAATLDPSGRPLLKGGNHALFSIYESRLPLYRQADGEFTGNTAEQLAQMIKSLL